MSLVKKEFNKFKIFIHILQVVSRTSILGVGIEGEKGYEAISSGMMEGLID